MLRPGSRASQPRLLSVFGRVSGATASQLHFPRVARPVRQAIGKVVNALGLDFSSASLLSPTGRLRRGSASTALLAPNFDSPEVCCNPASSRLLHHSASAHDRYHRPRSSPVQRHSRLRSLRVWHGIGEAQLSIERIQIANFRQRRQLIKVLQVEIIKELPGGRVHGGSPGTSR